MNPALLAALAIPAAPCGGEGGAQVDRERDAVLGPLAILGARLTPDRPRDAFEQLGYKLPVTIAEGTAVTLTVPRRLRAHVRLVFRPRAQRRVYEIGVRGGDAGIRLRPCALTSGRAGWPGGIVVDRRRCVTLVATPAGGPPIRRRVPVGRRC